jgi:hypothetical protein
MFMFIIWLGSGGSGLSLIHKNDPQFYSWTPSSITTMKKSVLCQHIWICLFDLCKVDAVADREEKKEERSVTPSKAEPLSSPPKFRLHTALVTHVPSFFYCWFGHWLSLWLYRQWVCLKGFLFTLWVFSLLVFSILTSNFIISKTRSNIALSTFTLYYHKYMNIGFDSERFVALSKTWRS